MNSFDSALLTKLYIPSPQSHKAQNGKVLIIAGSRLFHAASLWPLTVASRIVDMVFYASVPENNELVKNAKEEFRNGIVIPRSKIEDYIDEANAILIGPGLPRTEGKQTGDDDTKELTENLLQKYPDKKWVIDGGSLQTIDPNIIKNLNKTPILTPHHGEYETLFGSKEIEGAANEFNCVILLKGHEDIVCSPKECIKVIGGNAGMTKGGTGDVLAGLVVALYAQNDDPFLVASSASYINKKAGESLFEKIGYYFNASDLANEIPKVMRDLIIQ